MTGVRTVNRLAAAALGLAIAGVLVGHAGWAIVWLVVSSFLLIRNLERLRFQILTEKRQ